jgi:hypothetical protein
LATSDRTSDVADVHGRGYCFAAQEERMEKAANPRPGGVRVGVRSNLPARGTVIVGRSNSIETISRIDIAAG